MNQLIDPRDTQTEVAQIVSDGAALPPVKRVFLLLQGPHGPFFGQLGQQLRAAGAQVWRVGFNAGDAFFWRDKARYIAHRGTPEEWPAHLERLLDEKGITDIVLYGDVRPIHAAACKAALRRGLILHVFEEGYLRPYWLTYERGGSNGHSRLMKIGLKNMREALRGHRGEIRRPPAHWGDMRQHKFYGALYHFIVLAANGGYPGFRSHRQISGWQEFHLHLNRLISGPFAAIARRIQTTRIRYGGYPFSLVLMQLEHDSNFIAHSPFDSMTEFTSLCLREFAEHAPQHHHIVFKAHPLEDDRANIVEAIATEARRLNITERVHFVRGGKLAGLLSQARSVITVNSTSAQQALWRGLPVKALGQAVYSKPGLVSTQPLSEFLVSPLRPDRLAYEEYRNFLIESSQVPGGFYAMRSRAHALRLVTDMMLGPDDPYAALAKGFGPFRQQIGQDR